MSSDPIPFDPTAHIGFTRFDGSPVEIQRPALDPMASEVEVLKVCNPEPIRHQLLRFVQRHAPGTSVVPGEIDGFNWQTGVLTLAKETAKGEGMRALLTVAHECGHANQKQDWPWLPWWLVKTPGISLWIETNCWHRALRMLT